MPSDSDSSGSGSSDDSDDSDESDDSEEDEENEEAEVEVETEDAVRANKVIPKENKHDKSNGLITSPVVKVLHLPVASCLPRSVHFCWLVSLPFQKPKLSEGTSKEIPSKEISSKEISARESSSKEVSSKKAKNKAIAGLFLKKAVSEKEHNEKRQKFDSEGMYHINDFCLCSILNM